MAGPGPAEQLRAEASCPVCLELFQEPVSIPCGHSFCRGCIERCWQSSRGSFSCPRCRNVAPEPGLRPNRELGHVADIARGLLPEAPGTLCGQHREPLRLFCRDERALLCLECGRSRLHRLHRVVPAEEAAQEYKVPISTRSRRYQFVQGAQGTSLYKEHKVPISIRSRRYQFVRGVQGTSLYKEYKEQIQNCLQALREEREKFLESRKSGAQRSLHLDKTRSEGQRLAQEFRELQRFLQEKERLLLAQLGDLDSAIGRAQDEALAKVSEELSQLDTLIWEMEGKFQQPPSRFLQDLQQLLDSCEMMKFHPPAEISSDLERSLEDFVQRNILTASCSSCRSRPTSPWTPARLIPTCSSRRTGKKREGSWCRGTSGTTPSASTSSPACWRGGASPRACISGRWRWGRAGCGRWAWCGSRRAGGAP
ncbi:zinc finger protein RFP-like isoform X4 [Poecile atricapillus]|uniref:zinc finger protein RFP-like isoform X4 n=1 Tax=Poecile atricapillus TaxID=48891 RepID=UPI0027396E4C|nr:zinc finger protein RFP-like isoform X4 [Poecile atricapillus]